MTAVTVTSDVRAWAPALDRKGLRDQPRLHNFPLVTSEAPAELGVEPRSTSNAHSPCLQVVTPSFTPKRGRASLARSPLNRLSGPNLAALAEKLTRELQLNSGSQKRQGGGNTQPFRRKVTSLAQEPSTHLQSPQARQRGPESSQPPAETSVSPFEKLASPCPPSVWS